MPSIKFIFLYCTVLTFAGSAFGQNTILELMYRQSEKVLAVKVKDVQLNHTDPTGITEWRASAEIKQIFKGGGKKGAPLNFYFNRLEYKRTAGGKPIKENLQAEKGKSYIVFLRRGMPCDRWLGIQPDSPYLEDAMQGIRKKMLRIRQVPIRPPSRETRF